LTVWNRTAAKMAPLVEAGAARAGSPAEVAAASDVVISIVSDSPDVAQVALGEGGVIESARQEMLYIDMSTISPRVAREVAARMAEQGAAMLDAPVSGGDKGAIEGTLSIMVGGPEEAFEQARPIFDVLGRAVTYMGPSGSGQATKLCNQTVCVLNILATCEGLLLAARSGLDPERLLSAITQGAAGSWMLQNLGPKIAARDFSPGFMVRLQQKDLRLVMEAAEELKLPLPGAALVNHLFRAVEAAGDGDLGTQALVTALERLAGFEVGGASAPEA
jgi:3-hydroxyisobutyrate dehydrogenase